MAREEAPDLAGRVERRRRRIEEARQAVAAGPRMAAAFDRDSSTALPPAHDAKQLVASRRRSSLVSRARRRSASWRRQKSTAEATLRTVCGASAFAPTPPS